MFAAKRFLRDNFESPDRVRTILRLYGFDVPKYDTAYSWFRRNSMPAETLMDLLACLEFERGKPVSVTEWLD